MKKTMKKFNIFFVIGVIILLLGYAEHGVKSVHEEMEPIAASKKLTVVKGDQVKLTVSAKGKVTWKSSKTKVATISKSGKLKAKKKGSTTITATYTKNGKTKKVTYKVKVVNPKLNVGKKTTVNKGETRQFKIKHAKNKVKWKSSNSSVVSVTSKGDITARAAGKATITATYHGKKYKTVVTVKDASGNSDNSSGGSGNGFDGGYGGYDDGGTNVVDEKAAMEASAEWNELWLQVDTAMMATYTGVNKETYTEDSFIAFQELATWYAGRRYTYQNYTQLMADINAYGYPDDKLVKFSAEEIKKKKDLELLYNSREWELLWTIVDKMLATEYDELNHVKESYDENYALAEWYLAKKESYTNLEQLNADVETYGYPDNVEYIPYTQEIISYPDVAKQVLGEINAYREYLNEQAGYEKYEPYVWNDECALVAKTQAVYNMKSCLYRLTSKDDANHGSTAIGTSGSFLYPRTDEERLDMASAAPNWSVQNWKDSTLHNAQMTRTFTEADKLRGYADYMGVAVVSSTWSSGLGHITVIAKRARSTNSEIIAEFELTPSGCLYMDGTVPITLGSSFYGSEITALFNDVREISGTTYEPLVHSPYAAYYGKDVESKTVSAEAVIMNGAVSVSDNSIQ